MAIKSGIFNSVNGDRRYKAEDFARYFATFIGNGVFPNPSTGLQVIANNDMSVTLKAGQAWINGYYLTNDADYNLAIDVADGVLKRIDRVVLQLNYLNREITPVVKKGTFASNPIAPSLQRDADAYELALADVLINNGATQITQANITDLRLNTELCGIVHGVVDQVDTTTIFNQYKSWFDEWTVEQEVEFNAWFQSIQDVLSGDVAGNLQAQITNLTSQINTLENAVDAHLADLASQEVGKGASLVGLHDAGGLFTSTDTEGALKEVMEKANSAFTSANDGKNLLETTIIGKKGSVSKVGEIATYNELNNGILSIQSGAEIKSIQSGETSLTVNNYYIDITISPVDIGSTVIIMSNDTSNSQSQSGGLASSNIIPYFINEKTIRFERKYNAGNSAINWQVVEFENVNVQSGVTTMYSSSRAVDLSQFNVSKSLLLFYHKGDQEAHAHYTYTRGRITNDTSITFSRRNGNQPLDVSYFLVEFL